jgi:Na+-transporting methylmalonyl-CoA/oxaloacetate decarboxylase gamma subunit
MIPDTFAGALTLTVVNILIVFLVLIVVAVIISLIHRIVSSSEKQTNNKNLKKSIDEEPGGVSEMNVGSNFEESVPEIQSFETLDPKRKAAILAAVYAYMGRSDVSVFVRRVPDSGTWGKTSRWMAINE